MRLTCPNCDAQYEVDDRAIPEAGRDVQCSNCGHAWFQLHPDFEDIEDIAESAEHGVTESAAPAERPDRSEPAPAPDRSADAAPPREDMDAQIQAAGAADGTEKAAVAAAPSADAAQSETAAETDPEAAPAPADGTAEQTAAVGAGMASGETEIAAPSRETEEDEAETLSQSELPAALAARRRSLASDVQSVLREEAERERRARASEAASLETQPDLGLDPPRQRLPGAGPLAQHGTPARPERDTAPAAAANTRPEGAGRAATAGAATGPIVAQMQKLDDETQDQEAQLREAARQSRRDLLPDIDEINSTLRASSERGEARAAPQLATASSDGGRGFRLGFGLGILIVVAATAIYAFAPELAKLIPAAEPALRRYVALVVEARDSMNVIIERVAAFFTASN